ncbi:unnamed protein product [Schistosoma mattheei]|uniref:Uncharacterized protein n=1 Tax=Schistosoma mattheei TaxID=31246 RepID=A0AA85C058_9TREM|nr:unnamed protein product [Schistosoma mattheei]
MELSTEHQSIDQCMLKHELIKQIYLMIVDMMCRSKLYQSIEQKILMGDEINMELSTEHQSIDQCMLKHELIKQIYLMIVDMMCRSKLYQSIEQKILMGDNQQLHDNFRRLDGLLRDRYGRIRVCNIYLCEYNNSSLDVH